jgi:hypothetical protein
MTREHQTRPVKTTHPFYRCCRPKLALIILAAAALTTPLLGSHLPVLFAIDGAFLHGPAVGFLNVWANGSHAALCDGAAMKGASKSSVACTAFLRRRAQGRDNAGNAMFVPWSPLGFHDAPDWAESLASNADIVAAAASGMFSQRLPPCANGVMRGTTVTTKYDWNIFFHVVMRGLWWQHRYGVVRAGGAAAAKAVDAAVTAAAPRLRGAQKLSDAAVQRERAILRAAAVDAAGIDSLWLKLDDAEEWGTKKVDPVLEDLLAVLARGRAQGDGAEFLVSQSAVRCFEALVPAFTHSFGVEAFRKWTGVECSAAGRDGAVPLFVAQLRAALGAPPPPALDTLPLACNRPQPSVTCTGGSAWEARSWRLPLSELCTTERPLLFALRSGGGGGRVLHNQATLITALRDAGAAVSPIMFGGSEWPPEAQARAVAGACGLLGLHGSALTNLLFLARHELALLVSLPHGSSIDETFGGLSDLACPVPMRLVGVEAGEILRGVGWTLQTAQQVTPLSNVSLQLPLQGAPRRVGASLSCQLPTLTLSPPVIELFPHVLPDELAEGGTPPQFAVYHNLACAARVPYAAYISPPEPGMDPLAYLGRDIRARSAMVDVGAVVSLVISTLERSLSIRS